MNVKEMKTYSDLIGKVVLVPWPGQEQVRVWFLVKDADFAFGHWQLLVGPPSAETGAGEFWTRKWFLASALEEEAAIP